MILRGCGVDVVGLFGCVECEWALWFVGGVDVVVIVMMLFFVEIVFDVCAVVQSGANVFMIVEEVVYLWVVLCAIADEFDVLVIECGVLIFGVGLNFGFVFDAFVFTIVGAVLLV